MESSDRGIVAICSMASIVAGTVVRRYTVDADAIKVANNLGVLFARFVKLADGVWWIISRVMITFCIVRNRFSP